MSKVHGFACVFTPRYLPPAPALARSEPTDTPALKAAPLAGRRGGESIARQISKLIYILLRKNPCCAISIKINQLYAIIILHSKRRPFIFNQYYLDT
ncbi:hypothetical protein CO697_21115 [Lelliottia amnigena]|nr:hypothetical protein CO697_21115 [Lelliottia amnigena]